MPLRLDPQRLDSSSPRSQQSRRLNVQTLIDLSQHLPSPDRALVEAILRRGATIAEVARLTGRNPRSLNKRIRVLLLRLRHPLYIFLHSRADAIPADIDATARHVIFRRTGLRGAARATGLSLHQVRRHIEQFRALVRASNETMK